MTGRRRITRAAGTTLIECTVALLILSLAMLGLAQLVAAASSQQRLTAAKSAALQEVANQAEQIAAMRWEETAPDKFTHWEPSSELASAIPAAACRVQSIDEPGPPASRRIRLEVIWPDPAGREQQPVGLTLWKFQPEGGP